MKRLDALRMLRRYPLFTTNELVRVLGKSPEYARLFIHRLEKEGLVFRLERGKYTAHDDPMVYSSHIVTPSYISFWSGLRFYNLTDQLPVEMMIASSRQRKAIELHGGRIRFYIMKQMWGYRKLKYEGFDTFVADKEKCIIDCLLLRNVPLDEVAGALTKSREFDAAKLIDYAKRSERKSLMKRLGYIMENAGMDNAEALTDHLDNNRIPLDWNLPERGEIDKKWKLIINRRFDDSD